MSRKSGWYVSYKGGCATVMHLHRDRARAIEAACDLLRRNLDVTEVGPMLEIRDGNVLNSAEIRRIWHERRRPDGNSQIEARRETELVSA